MIDVPNLAERGAQRLHGIKQLFERLHRSGAKVDRESDGAVRDFWIGEEVHGRSLGSRRYSIR